jgi:hypothetical protein
MTTQHTDAGTIAFLAVTLGLLCGSVGFLLGLALGLVV